jgi:hypothetical protein
MAVTSKAEGSQTATVTTEHTLSTITDPGVYQLSVDCNAMALGDELELRAKLKVRSTGTTRQLYLGSYAHVQGDPVKVSIPVSAVSEVVFTLKQTVGTGRTFPWEVIQLQ